MEQVSGAVRFSNIVPDRNVPRSRKGVARADAWRFTIGMAGKQYTLSGHRGRI